MAVLNPKEGSTLLMDSQAFSGARYIAGWGGGGGAACSSSLSTGPEQAEGRWEHVRS